MTVLLCCKWHSPLATLYPLESLLFYGICVFLLPLHTLWPEAICHHSTIIYLQNQKGKWVFLCFKANLEHRSTLCFAFTTIDAHHRHSNRASASNGRVLSMSKVLEVGVLNIQANSCCVLH